MGDLISRSALIENIDNDIKMTEQFMNSEMDTKRYSQLFTQLNTLKSYKGIIEEMPTAYDVENVVAELEKEKEIHTNHYNISIYKDFPDVKQRYKQIQLVISKSIDIVKRGGVE